MVRFIRCYDICEDRMVNVWQNLTPQQAEEQIFSVEWTATGPDFESVMAKLERVPWLADELPQIREAYKDVRPAKPSIYYTAQTRLGA